jgi:hypothetical protein
MDRGSRKPVSSLVVGVLLLAAGFSPSSHAFARGCELAATTAAPVGSGWIVDRADNICGLDDGEMLSNPARVDYDRLLSATPEMKRIRDEGIAPDSSKGIQLRQAAVDRVRRASDAVRAGQGHCSVWKRVRHRDGRSVPDITDAVLKAL